MLRIILLKYSFFTFILLNKNEIYQPSSKINPYELYKTAYEAFEKMIFFANKKFTEAELNFEIEELAKVNYGKLFSLRDQLL